MRARKICIVQEWGEHDAAKFFANNGSINILGLKRVTSLLFLNPNSFDRRFEPSYIIFELKKKLNKT